jgi:hypothetical protein
MFASGRRPEHAMSHAIALCGRGVGDGGALTAIAFVGCGLLDNRQAMPNLPAMLYLFRRLIDSIEARKEAAELRRKREAIPPDVDPDQLDVVVPPRRDIEPDRVCRICGLGGKDRFCPTCLAETMEPVSATRGPGR